MYELYVLGSKINLKQNLEINLMMKFHKKKIKK